MSVDRLEATRALVEALDDEFVVAALGNPAYDLYLAGDRPHNFYMWGAMGLACSVGLGLAKSVPNAKVIVLDGDGSILMNLGALTTIGVERPTNLVHIVWDNRSYDLTGGQPTATAQRADLVQIACGAGLDKCRFVASLEEFVSLVPDLLEEQGPWFVAVDTGPTPKDRVKPQASLRRRFLDLDQTIDRARAQKWV